MKNHESPEDAGLWVAKEMDKWLESNGKPSTKAFWAFQPVLTENQVPPFSPWALCGSGIPRNHANFRGTRNKFYTHQIFLH